MYGHHPIFSDGHHGDEKRLNLKLLPLLKQYKVDAYLAGHEHEMQHLEMEGMQFFIAGGGGKDTRRIRPKRGSCGIRAFGFLELEATQSQLTLRLRGTDGKDVCPAKVLTK